MVIHQRQVPVQRQEHVRLWVLWLLCPGQWQLEPSHQDSYWGEALRLPILPTPHYPKEPSKESCCVETWEGDCWVTENVLNLIAWDPAWEEKQKPLMTNSSTRGKSEGSLIPGALHSYYPDESNYKSRGVTHIFLFSREWTCVMQPVSSSRKGWWGPLCPTWFCHRPLLFLLGDSLPKWPRRGADGSIDVKFVDIRPSVNQSSPYIFANTRGRSHLFAHTVPIDVLIKATLSHTWRLAMLSKSTSRCGEIVAMGYRINIEEVWKLIFLKGVLLNHAFLFPSHYTFRRCMLLFQQCQRLNSHEIFLFSSREWTCQNPPVAGIMKGLWLLHTPLVSWWHP